MPAGNPAELLPLKLKAAQISFLMQAGGAEGYKQRLYQMGAAFEPLQAMERQIFGHFGDGALAYGALDAGAAALRQWMGHTFYRDYSYVDMARDAFFCELHGATAPAILEACWEAASLAGVWWPFERAVVIADRPVSLERDTQAAAILTYSDGWKAHPYVAKAARSEVPPKLNLQNFLRLNCTVNLPRGLPSCALR